MIVFGDQTAGLQRIPASGGTPSLVTRVNKEAGETYHYYPQFLPGGKQFLYLVRHGDAEKMGIYIGSLDGKPGRRRPGSCRRSLRRSTMQAPGGCCTCRAAGR